MITKKEFSQAIKDNASVVAGVIGKASSKKDGLLSSEQYNWLNLIAKKVGTTETSKYIKINGSGKLSMMCGTIGNGNNAGVLHIARTNQNETVALEIKAKWIKKPSWAYRLSYVKSGTHYDLYIGSLASWSECSIIKFTGTVNSCTAVESVPEDAVAVTISD